MDIDAARRTRPLPAGNCYRCGQPGHMKAQCPRAFDIRYMTMEEVDEMMQQRVLAQDAEEAQAREEAIQATVTEESVGEGFVPSDE